MLSDTNHHLETVTVAKGPSSIFTQHLDCIFSIADKIIIFCEIPYGILHMEGLWTMLNGLRGINGIVIIIIYNNNNNNNF